MSVDPRSFASTSPPRRAKSRTPSTSRHAARRPAMDSASTVFPQTIQWESRRHQPHSVHGLHRGRPAPQGTRAAALPEALVVWESRCGDSECRRLHRRWSGHVRHHGPRTTAASVSRTSAGIAACSSAGSATPIRKDAGFTCRYHESNYTHRGRSGGRSVPSRRHRTARSTAAWRTISRRQTTA